MPYIGNTIRAADDYRLIDDISSGFNGSATSFALQVAGSSPVPFPKSPQQILISVNGVIQEPDPTGASGFNLVGTNIVFSSAPTNGHAFFGIIYATADYLNAGGNFPAGSLGAPSLTFIGDEDTGIYRKGSGSIGFVSNSTEIANTDSNGLTISSGDLILPDSITHSGDSNTKIRFPAADTFSVETGGSERFRVDSSGHILPGADSQYNIGATANRFANGFFDTLYGNGANLTGIDTDLVSDTSPQLGGNLDVNGNDIVSTSNADIDIVPHGTGKTSLGGTSGVKLPVGDTSERVNVTGVIRFNSETGLPEYFNGTSYISIDSPPAVSSVSPTEVDSTAAGNQSFTITGARFSVGATVKFISSNGTEINASSVTRNSATQLTAVAARSSFVNAQEPYDVKVTNSSGLATSLADQINVDSAPSWQTSAGTLGTKTIGDSVSITVSATDAEGDTVSYSVSSGSLPSGLSINSTTGVISGTLGGSAATTTFDLRATAGGKTADRTYNIVSVNPATGGNNIVTYSHGGVNYKVHVFTSNGTFTRSAVSSADILVVGGGGGAGFGGGGAGALVWGASKTLTDSTYTVTIGAGGSGTEGTASSSGFANPGADSSFGSLVVAEGGGAGGRIQSVTDGNSNSGPGGDGGSGGGGGHPSVGNASSGAGGSAITGNSTGGTIHGNDGGAGFNCCNGGGGGGAGQVGQAGVGDPGNGENTGGNGNSTFVGNAASTSALLFVADLGTDGSGTATSSLSSDPGTLFLAGGGGGAYGSPRGGYGGGGTGGVSSGNTSGRTSGLTNSGSGGGGANSVGKPGGSGVVLVRYTVS